MAIKKSDLYSSIWASCDELRGGMDANQYKDYVLFMLFIKYVSDKYADYDGFEPPIVIPRSASFNDMVTLKGDADIGNKINTDIIQKLIEANASSNKFARTDFPDFNDPNKLGEPAEQTAIAAVLSDMDAELAALETRRDKIRALKQAMMQELLTGRTRLI